MSTRNDNTLRIDDDVPENNVEIFAELLGNTDVSEEHVTSPSPNIVQCSEDCVIHWEPGLRDVVVGADHVITCCTKDDAVRISVYPRSDSFRDGSDDRLRISSNPLYRTALTTDISKNGCTAENQTVLLYLKPSDVTSSGCASGTIDQQVFHEMFRTEVRSNVHMALLGTDSGMVGYIPVAAGIHDAHVAPEVLYHLGQPVAAMSTVCLSNNDSKKSVRNTLILVGSLGKFVLVTLQDRRQPGARGVQFREYHIPGPVVSSTVNASGDVFFYTTLKQVYAVPLRYTEGSEERGGGVENSSSSGRLPLSLSPILFPLPKVSFVAVEQSCAEETKTESLLCVKTDGRVLLVEQPLEQLEKIGFRSHVTAQVSSGERIRRCLADIQESSDCVSHLREDIQELDNVIKQLNIATHAACEILRNPGQTRASRCSSRISETCDENPGISFSVQVDYEAQGGRSEQRVILRCDLVNSTKFPLSRGWSMVVQVHTRYPWCNENHEAPQVASHSVSLDSSFAYRISIPLEANSLIYLSPIEVSCFICFDLKEILPAGLKASHPALAAEGFAVLVRNSKLSVLNFLRNVDSTVSTTTFVSENYHHPSPNEIQVLQQTLRNLNTSPQISTPSLQASKKPGLSTTPELCTASIHLSKEAVEFIHRRVQKSIVAANFDEPRSISVLYFLLFDSRKHLRFDNAVTRGNYIRTRVPNEEEVKLQVLRSSQAPSCALGDGLEVRIHTSSEALKCSVHSAVLGMLEVCGAGNLWNFHYTGFLDTILIRVGSDLRSISVHFEKVFTLV